MKDKEKEVALKAMIVEEFTVLGWDKKQQQRFSKAAFEVDSILELKSMHYLKKAIRLLEAIIAIKIK